MIIIGAKGFAKELLEVFHQLGQIENLVFFDNVSSDLPNLLFNKFKIIQNEKQVKDYFLENGPEFVLGIGNPELRMKMSELFKSWGGNLQSIISPHAHIGSFNNVLGDGNCIMTGSIITNDIVLGQGNLVNLNTTIGHDTHIGDYCEICPGAHISGNVTIGNQCFIGTGAVILPGIKLGERVVVGAGAVVTRDIPSYQQVKGIPAR